MSRATVPTYGRVLRTQGDRRVQIVECSTAGEEPTELAHDIRSECDFQETLAPTGEVFLLVRGIRPVAERATAVVEHDSEAGQVIGQLGDLRELRVKEPDVQGQVELFEFACARANLAFREHVGPFGRLGILDHGTVVPARAEPDASKAALTGVDVALEYLLDRFPESQVGEADDATRDLGRMLLGLDISRDFGDVLRLPDRPERLGPCGPVAHRTFDVHRGGNTMAGGEVGREVLRTVRVRPFPQVMMSVHDDELRLLDHFWCRQCEPRVIRLVDRTVFGRPPGRRAPEEP